MQHIDKKYTPEEAFSRLSARCATAECAPLDLIRKMEGWGLDETEQMTVMERLKKYKYVDEQRFASAYVRDKFQYSGWGKLKIMQGLRQKGISGEVAARAWQEIPEEEYEALLMRLLTTKSESVRAASRFEKYGKLMRFALSRGFEQWMVADCLERLPQSDNS